MIGQVNVTLMNLGQGATEEVEGTFLFLGAAAGGHNTGEYITIGADSDLDELLGEETSDLKTQISAALANAESENWMCYAIPYDTTDSNIDWTELVESNLDKPNDLGVEAVVMCEPIPTTDAATAVAFVESAQTLANTVKSSLGKFIQVILATDGCGAAESWTEYKTRIKTYISGVAAENVCVVPQTHGNNLGVVCGRLCNPGVNIADTPMRVATGALVDLGSAPTDVNGSYLKNADYKELSSARFCVPQYYVGFEGMYWADMMTLDAEGGDYQYYEYMRIALYHARRIRIMAIRKIADRSLNSTDASIAANEQYFGRILRAASKSLTIAGQVFPGMNEPPEDGDVSITWKSNTEVNIALAIRPYNCPKKINVYIALDLSSDDE